LNSGPISGNSGGESSIITFRGNDPPASCIYTHTHTYI
jgi:hypothetical protein